jgi:hypothetical protein
MDIVRQVNSTQACHKDHTLPGVCLGLQWGAGLLPDTIVQYNIMLRQYISRIGCYKDRITPNVHMFMPYLAIQCITILICNKI